MSWEDAGNRILQTIGSVVARSDAPAADRLDQMFEILAAYRAARLKAPLAAQLGDTVVSGPFQGMRFLDRVAEGAYIPKLLGSYEAELHPLIERISAADYDDVVNIGCAEGYYAVGLALRLSSAKIHAYDIDGAAQTLCRALAHRNAVAERLTIAGEFQHDDFNAFAGRRVLVLCDIEGAEVDLLDPVAAPSLRQFDLLVEIHQDSNGWTSETLFPRFTDTHRVTEFGPQPRSAADYPALRELSQADQFFALLERIEPTRWAWLEAMEKPDR